MQSMTHELTGEVQERASATANIIVSSLIRLQREHGPLAVSEAWRLVISALPCDEKRLALLMVLAAIPL